MKARFFTLITLGTLLFYGCTQVPLTIVDRGTSDYEIVFFPSVDNEKAAYVLQEYIEKITGVQLAVKENNPSLTTAKKIVVGTDNRQNLDDQEIVIRTENSTLYLYGGSPLASKNAVYTFLRDYLGCRWYAPEAIEIPENKSIKLEAIDYRYTPAIKTRTVHARLFYENHAFADAQKVTYEPFPFYVPEARVHTFHRFMPEETYYKSNPEYYALRGDRRLPTQLCLSNPDVLRIVNEKVAAHFAAFPNAKVISVSQDDNQQHCQCKQCSAIDEEAGSPAGSMIRFVNQIAANFPEKTISTLAYQYTRTPPKVKPLENVLITLCSIECDRSAPIAEKCKDFEKDLIGWGALTDNIRIWDYTTQFTNFLAPFPNVHTLKPNVLLFRDNNAKWVFEQHSNHPSELFELRAYITAQLLWNPDQDFDALMDDFIFGYYKEAGSYIKKYVTTINAEIEKHPDFFLFLYGDPSQAFDAFLSPDLLDQYVVYFDQAEKSVRNQPVILNRVKQARLGIDYAVLEACRKNITPTYRLIAQNSAGNGSISPVVEPVLERFEATTSANEITLMNEMGFTVKEYLTTYKKAIATASKPNKAVGKKVVSLTSPKKYANEDPMVLTDGALGGSSFFSNWLGYEGNDMEIVIDLGTPTAISSIDLSFLQVTNHVVFFPHAVTYQGSLDGNNYTKLSSIKNKHPLNKSSKVNDIQNFGTTFPPTKVQFVKINASNVSTPYWHYAAGLPSWVFADEIIIN